MNKNSKKLRGVFVAGNWKMNHGPAEAAAFVAKLATTLKPGDKKPGLRVAVLTPSVSIAPTLSAILASPQLKGFLEAGAQNAHFEDSGAFTGEISGQMLKELGAPLTLVGHSERRQHFGETDESAGQRLASLLAQGVDVIFCIGETLSQRQAGLTQQVITHQLNWAWNVALSLKKPWDWKHLILAYEPVWAIGTGVTATSEQAQEVHGLIRSWLKEKGSEASKTPILYGGSVTPQNFSSLLACPDVDGGLIGGASLKPESFLKLIEAGAQAI
ncbi:MAG: triose-phosphate isomerase [Oligoflexia bacterium]|jgi:triosephosphate isomerase